MEKTVILDGDNFNSLESFYDEVQNKLTKNFEWNTGRNLDAFNDVLYGGFGIHDYENPLTIVWVNHRKSRIDLGWNETIRYLEHKLEVCHPDNRESVKNDLELARMLMGEMLIDLIVGIIQRHNHIKLILL